MRACPDGASVEFFNRFCLLRFLNCPLKQAWMLVRAFCFRRTRDGSDSGVLANGAYRGRRVRDRVGTVCPRERGWGRPGRGERCSTLIDHAAIATGCAVSAARQRANRKGCADRGGIGQFLQGLGDERGSSARYAARRSRRCDGHYGSSRSSGGFEYALQDLRQEFPGRGSVAEALQSECVS